jgi:RsiW-degrading membrane proteinase PrsW (M82 family)
MDWMKILGTIAGIMMLVFLWPAYKHWSQNSPKAEKGDWATVMLVLGAVVLFVILLIASVR